MISVTHGSSVSRRTRRHCSCAKTMLLAFLLATTSLNAYALPFHVGGLRLEKSIVSFAERRNSRLVRQNWDTSCGAAALSTVLTYYNEHPISEASIVASILHNTDPNRVRQRGGFSLLDLKRFADAVGFVGKGYGGLTVEDLKAFGIPAIVPVRIRDYDHFVVFKGSMGEIVVLGDPAFGNLSMTIDAFRAIWANGIGFIVSRHELEPGDLEPLTPDTMVLSVPNLNALSRFTHRTLIQRTRLRPILLR